MGKLINLINQRFGKLVVIEDLGTKNGKHYWKCQCDCGNIKEVPGSYLRYGTTKSCGCMKSKGLQEYNIKESEKNKISIGTKFGKLVVIEDLGFKPHVEGHNRRFYKCQCDCGNITEASGNQLKSGNKKTCGHCENSLGELNILKILTDNNLFFKHDYALPELQTFCGKRLRFDFILYNENGKINRVIEFDGRQHIYGPDTDYWGHSTESLEDIKNKDEIKNNFCHSKNIPIVRIPYWKRDNITLEDLLGDKYLI